MLLKPFSMMHKSTSGGTETLFDHGSYTPNNSTTDETTSGWYGYMMGNVVTFAVNGNITSLWWYRHSGDSYTTRTAYVWNDATEAIIGEGTGSTPTTSAWNEVVLDSPVAVTTGNQYVVSFIVPGPADYTSISNFGDSDTISGNITAPDNTEAGGQGRYSYTGQSGNDRVFPGSSFNNEGYGVSLTFEAS